MKATEVTAGLAESNGSLLPGLWRDSLHVTCRLTACTLGSAPGRTLVNEYGKTLPFTLHTNVLKDILSLRKMPNICKQHDLTRHWCHWLRDNHRRASVFPIGTNFVQVSQGTSLQSFVLISGLNTFQLCYQLSSQWSWQYLQQSTTGFLSQRSSNFVYSRIS